MSVILIAATLIWLFAAAITDIKKREVSDWLSFSLVSIGIFSALLTSVISNNYNLLLWSAIFFAIFIIIANAFYYLKLFGGGDAKLLIALGPILPQLSFNSILNLPSALTFLLNCTFIGALYGMIWSLCLAIIHKKQFKENISKLKFPVLPFIVLPVLAVILLFVYPSTYLLITLILLILFPFLYIFTKAVENVALIKNIKTEKLTEGDWLAHPVKIKGRVISAKLGLTKKDIEFLKKHKKEIAVKEGIPFVPVFLLAFILSLLIGNLFEFFIRTF